jgi:hypothetical protein
MKVLLISSAIPDSSGGGQLLLQRHLIGVSPIELAVALPTAWTGPERSFVAAPSAFWRRLSATRFNARVQLLRDRLGATCALGPLLDFARSFAPDVVLTVAHGPLSDTAKRVAQRLGRPLASIFHDWWPDLAPRGSGETDAGFRALYRASHTAFCVSDGMRRELGPHQDAPVLLPIPGRTAVVGPAAEPGDVFTLVYTGSLNDVYQPGLEELTRRLENHHRIRIELWGDASWWPAERREALHRAGVYHGPAHNDDLRLQTSLARADALLTHMSFASSHERRVRTSFPSKLADYTRWAKPLVFWGPSYSSAAEWLRHRAAAVLIEDPSPANAVAAIEALANNREQQRALSSKAAAFYAHELSPVRLQQMFLDGLARCIASHKCWSR